MGPNRQVVTAAWPLGLQKIVLMACEGRGVGSKFVTIVYIQDIMTFEKVAYSYKEQFMPLLL